MKKFLFILPLTALLYSCTTPKPSYPGSTSVKPPERLDRDPQFLENIVLKTPGSSDSSIDKTLLITSAKPTPIVVTTSDIEKCNELQFKYAILMEEPVELVTDAKLIHFIENWYGVPYRYGGGTKKGIDCSAFSSLLMESVYNVNVARTTREQYTQGSKVSRSQLKQGDLVFFNTTGGVSHVGVYLSNNKFVHAATSAGVMISDLEDAYFKRRYMGATRLK